MDTPLVSVEWLKNNLTDPNLVILDATQKIDAKTLKNNPDKLSIPNARYFNIKEVFSDASSPYPNMLPTQEIFQKECRNLGLNNSNKLVVYDSVGIFSSPRVWWMFHVMGFSNIAVLDGGLPEWLRQGYTTENMTEKVYPAGDFNAKLNPQVVKDAHFIENNIDLETHLVVDARSSGRFNGTAPEPRQGLASGCIPNSINIPHTTLHANGLMKSKEELKSILEESSLVRKPMIFSCGSGITACIVLLAMQLAYGDGAYSVYDGSWTEWATIHS